LVAVQVSEGTSNLGRSLDELNTKTSRDVEGNVAMEKPSSWVVCLESNDGVAAWAWIAIVAVNREGVSAHGVGQIVAGASAVTGTGRDNPKVVAVEMDWVGKRSLIDDEVINPSFRVDDDTIFRRGELLICAIEDIVKSWNFPVDVHGDTVDLPEYTDGRVKSKSQVQWCGGRAWDSGVHDRDDLSLVVAALGKTQWFRYWEGRTGASVRNDGSFGVTSSSLLVGTVTDSSTSADAEIVVCCRLVGFNNNVKALTCAC
jgi:hypothetical protein